MAATFDVFFKITGVLNGMRESIGQLNAPSSITTSADIISKSTTTVANTATEVVLRTGAPSDLDIASVVAIVVIPTVSGQLSWAGLTDADNSSAVMRANVPFILPAGRSTAYDTLAGDRASTASEEVSIMYFYNNSGASGKVHVFAIG